MALFELADTEFNMSKEILLDIIDINRKIDRGDNGNPIPYDQYMAKVKPLIEDFENKYNTTPNLYIQQYLKEIGKLDKPFTLTNFGYRGRNSIKNFTWACYHYKYPELSYNYASYSPQLYILVHTNGLKFGLDYGKEINDHDPLVEIARNRSDIIKEIINCNKKVTAYSLRGGANYLGTDDDRVYFNNEQDVNVSWNNSIHLINQFSAEDIPDNIDEVINETLVTLLPLFEKLCMIKVQAYTEPSQIVSEDVPDADDEVLEEPVQITEYKIENFLKDVFVDEATAKLYKDNLLHKKNVILQGPPGTGKTFIAKRIAYLILGQEKDENIRAVQFHQSYSYEDFIQGYRPNLNGGFERKNGLFYDFVENTVRNKPDEPFFLIVDEINRGNLSKIFGELLMLIEADKRGESYALHLTYEPDKKFFIPPNLYIIGTMNTADRSLAMVDYALRRRFRFLDVEPKFDEKLRKHLSVKGISETLTDKIFERIKKLNNSITTDDNLGDGFCVGHSYFCSIPENLTEEEKWYEQIIRFEIAPLLKEYWFDDLNKAEAEINLLSE